MKKKVVGIFVCMLMLTTAYSVTGTKLSKNASSTKYIETIQENLVCQTGLAPEIINQVHNEVNLQANNIKETNSKSVLFYAYNTYDPSGQLVEGPVYFYPTDPGTIIQIAPTSSNDFISGGTWTDDNIWYGCEYGVNGNPNIWTIDNLTGDMTIVGSYYPEAQSLNGLAYDTVTDILYGCSDSELYKINMTTGAATLVGSFGIPAPFYMIGLSFDRKGNLYGDELLRDILYKIDPLTANVIPIGPLGINIEYAQDMAYDNDTDTMYLAAYTILPTEGALYSCNLTTGAATKIGKFQGSAQITGFAIPYEAVPQPDDTTPPVTTHILDPAVPDGLNDWYVTNVTIKFNATDNMSGVAWTKYSLDGGTTWSYHMGSLPFDIIVSDFRHQLVYYSKDNAGNTEKEKGPFEFKVDTTKPDSKFYRFHILFGPVIDYMMNIWLFRDLCSGLDRVDFYVNNVFDHQVDLSNSPVGIWRPVFWLYNGSSTDKCTATVYDKAGQNMKPQTIPVVHPINNINTQEFLKLENMKYSSNT